MNPLRRLLSVLLHSIHGMLVVNISRHPIRYYQFSSFDPNEWFTVPGMNPVAWGHCWVRGAHSLKSSDTWL